MAVAEPTVFGRHRKEEIMRDIILTHPEAKSLFRINDCSLHRESFFVFAFLREPIIIELAFQNLAHWAAIGS